MAQLPHILPDYMLVFAVPVLTHCPLFESRHDIEQLHAARTCLWFILEALIVKNESYCYGFYKELIDKMKNHVDACCIDDNVNEVCLPILFSSIRLFSMMGSSSFIIFLLSYCLFYFSRAYFSFFNLNDKNSQLTQNWWKSFNQKGILLEFSSFVRALHDSSYGNIAVIITFLSRWKAWADY